MTALHRMGRRRGFLIDARKYTGMAMMAYGQTAITENLYAARDAAGGQSSMKRPMSCCMT